MFASHSYVIPVVLGRHSSDHGRFVKLLCLEIVFVPVILDQADESVELHTKQSCIVVQFGLFMLVFVLIIFILCSFLFLTYQIKPTSQWSTIQNKTAISGSVKFAFSRYTSKS